MFAIFLQEVVARVAAHMTVEAFVLSGSHAVGPMPHNLSWGLASARRRGHTRGRGQSGAHDCQGVCALGVARGRADASQFVMGARFGEAAWAQCARGPGAFSRGRILPGCLGGLNFRILAARNRDRSGVHDGRGVFALGDRQ